METKEKYEQLIEEQSQELKRELDDYRAMIKSADILSMPKDDIKKYISNLLEHQKALLLLFPQLTSSLQIINFFWENNALELEQVTIALNNILTDERVKDCLANKEKYQLQVKRIESEIKELDEKSLTAKASFILKANITDEEKISILKGLAYESCKNAPTKEETIIKEPEKESEEIETLFSEETNVNEEELKKLKEEYLKIKNSIENIINKYYYLIIGKDEKYINYAKEMSRAIKAQERQEGLNLSTLGIDEFQYKDISMTVLLLDMLETKQELELQLDNPNTTLEDISDYFNMLKEDYNKAIALDSILTEEKIEEEKTTNEIYFLLDESNSPFFDMDNFSKDDKKRCQALIEKFEKGVHDHKKGKKHTKFKSNYKKNNIYINRSSNMCVSYIRTKDNKVLILTFADFKEVFDNTEPIALNFDYLIDETLANIKNNNVAFLETQKEFTEYFKEQTKAKGDEHK